MLQVVAYSVDNSNEPRVIPPLPSCLDPTQSQVLFW